MEYRTLGQTDLKVSAICLGTMTWGDQNTEAEGHQQMDYALERGINFFDTAEMYSVPPKAETQGSTERVIGSWFKARGNRSKVILATKVAGRSLMTWFRKDGSPTRLNRAQMTEALDGSLKRLQTDYIDLYQLHFPDRCVSWGTNHTTFKPADYGRAEDETPIAEQLDVLADFVRAGKVRHIGLSNENGWGTMSFLHDSKVRGTPRAQSIQNAYSLVNRTFEIGLAEIALREKVGLLAYSPLAQGYLTGKYRGGALPQGSRKQLYNRLQRYETPAADAAFEAYFALAEEFGLDPAQLALAFVTSRVFTTANIIGASSKAQLKIAIDSTELKWTPELEERVNAIHLIHQNPCP